MQEITILKIQQEMEVGEIQPRQLADYRAFVTAQIIQRTRQLQDIEKRYPLIWQTMRKNQKSAVDTDREYDATEDGIQRTWLKSELKMLDKMSSSLNQLWKQAELEARNMM